MGVLLYAPKLAIKRPNPLTFSLISIIFMAYQIQAKLLVAID